MPFSIQAQEEASVEKSIFGIQAGIMGVWANNEIKLSNTIALRSEVGFEITNWRIGNTFYRRGDNTAFIPLVLTVEPKWYFNIKQRYAKNNTARFLSLMIRYHADWLMLSGKQPSNIAIIPTIAGRYHLGKHFNCEIGGGMGYQHTFTSIEEKKDDWAFNVVLRIGYVF